jgi:hypothetical protein
MKEDACGIRKGGKCKQIKATEKERGPLSIYSFFGPEEN